MNKTFILAFNYMEVKSLINKNPGDYIILNRPDQLYGTVSPTIRIMPNAYRREDFLDMMDAITSRRGNIVYY
jgi:hypothetical protein